MTDKKLLSLLCMAIGSLPHQDIDEAMSLVEENFKDIPFWPQLSKMNKNENMVVQFLENMPACDYDENNDKMFLNTEKVSYIQELEQLFIDWEDIIVKNDVKVLNKYAISKNYSSTFSTFLNIVERIKPKFAKGQIVGPFTLSTTLTDKSGRSVYYDVTLREVITRVLSLKALWQIKEIKRVSPNTIPIIFLDEPSLSQLRTSAYVTISPDEPVEQIKTVLDLIKANGGISAIHCCGRCDWANLIKTGCDIINFDAYNHSEHFLLFSNFIAEFLKNGGKIAWGLVPTLNEESLKTITVQTLKNKFYDLIEKLSLTGLDKDFIKENSLITPSCGAASLPAYLADKAMKMTKMLVSSISVNN